MVADEEFVADAGRLAALTRRIAALARAVPVEARSQRLVSTPDWTPHDLLAHVADLTTRYAEGFHDRVRFAPSFERSPEWTTEVSRAYRQLAYEQTVDVIAAAAEPLEQAALAVGPDATFHWHADAVVPVRGGVGITINELLVHGWDLATGTGQEWPLAPADVGAGVGGALHAIEPVIDPVGATGHSAVYELRARDAGRYVLRIRDGVGSVGVAGEDRPDVVLSAPAATLLLTMYRRRSVLWSITMGRAIAFGRRPWLALSLTDRLRPF